MSDEQHDGADRRATHALRSAPACSPLISGAGDLPCHWE
jgi:hypothetical protein